MSNYISVLTIAGSDCSGGAGIQADTKTISAIGCYAASVITAVTAQNTCGVNAVFPIPPDIVKAQLTSVIEDFPLQAIKIGMVADRNVILAIAEVLSALPYPCPIVFDPVLVSSSGHKLIEDHSIDAICRTLIPCCTVLTPNIPEAEILSGHTIRNVNDMIVSGKDILQLGCSSVLVKGGHLPGNEMTDILVCGAPEHQISYFHGDKICSSNTHGTGCTLSSALASYLALGHSLQESVKYAKEFLTQALKAGQNITFGKGKGPLNHFFDPEKLVIS